MEKHTLFLGVAITETLSQALKQLSPEIYSTFVNDTGEYLCEQTLQNQPFLGKIIGEKVSLADFSTLEEHIRSLLKKIAPSCPDSDLELVVLPLHG